ncbi:MAG: FAD-binding oxidoreductase [Myxococcales bacterium]|jgi:FAD/FMN-containing dehydrogenase
MIAPERVPPTPVQSVASPLARHDAKVARVARQLRERTSTRPLSLRKRAVSHQVPKPGDRKYSDEKIDVSDLDEILEIDPASRVCVAEPGVTFVDLVAATLPYGLVPFVVPELKTITIGGAVSGCSLESMSFRYGGFHDSCLEYEVITSDGEVLTCTPENEHKLVFHMIHGSFGTLGILSKIKFKLIAAKPFVRLDYETYRTYGEYHAAIAERCRQADVDFIDGIIHGPDRYVLSVGRFVDKAPYTSRYYGMTAYYETTAKRKEDYFTTPEYFFRYDRGVTNVRPKSRLGRLLLGRFVRSTEVLKLAEKLAWALPRENPTLTVDVFIPFSRFGDFMEWYWREFGPFPLWCVPYRPAQRYHWLSDEWYAGLEDEMFVDLAVYGFKGRDGRNYYRMLEEKLQELNGVKTLISFNYYSEEEFWRIWHKENHFAVKARTDRRNLFRDLYTKTCLASRGLD